MKLHIAKKVAIKILNSVTKFFELHCGILARPIFFAKQKFSQKEIFETRKWRQHKKMEATPGHNT